MNRALLRAVPVTAATAALSLLAIPPAQADHEPKPTVEKLLEDCDSRTDFCEFTVTNSRELLGERRQVSDAVYNCAPDAQKHTVTWSDTVSNSVSAGLSMTAEYGFTQVFKVSVTASLGYEWRTSETTTEAYTMELRPGWVGWVDRAPSLTEVTGDYELHYGSRQWGHYYWFAKNVVHTGPSENSRGNVIQQARPMTDQEKERCASNPASTSSPSSVKALSVRAAGTPGGMLVAPDRMDSDSAVTSVTVPAPK